MPEEITHRDTAREEYFYQKGRLEAFREAGATAVAKAYEAVVRNALEQVND
jgi:hypothetical protein